MRSTFVIGIGLVVLLSGEKANPSTPAPTNFSTFSPHFDTDLELKKLSTSCDIKPEDFKRMTGFTMRLSRAKLFAHGLLGHSVFIIGLSEMRKALGFGPLPPWKIYNGTESSKQELAAASTIEAYYELKEPRDEQRSQNSTVLYKNNTTPAIEFLEERFPVVREIFIRNFHVIHQKNPGAVDKKLVDLLLKEFEGIRRKIRNAVDDMLVHARKCRNLEATTTAAPKTTTTPSPFAEAFAEMLAIAIAKGNGPNSDRTKPATTTVAPTTTAPNGATPSSIIPTGASLGTLASDSGPFSERLLTITSTPATITTSEEAESLKKIAETCLTKYEHEELIGHILRYDSISTIMVHYLNEESAAIIGLTELRSKLGFGPMHPWKAWNKTNPSEEEIMATPTVEAYYDLKEPRSNKRSLSTKMIFEKNTIPGIAFLNKKFPAIRKMFRQRFEAIREKNPGKITRKMVDIALEEYEEIQKGVAKALDKMRLNGACDE